MYLFYLGGMLLPVTPSGYELREKNKNRTVDLLQGGEVSLPRHRGLCEISFSALLPMVNYPFSVYEGGFKDGRFFADALRNIKKEANPVWLRILRYKSRSSTDIYCTIEELTFKEEALNGGDITCEIVLKEYAGYETRVIDTDRAVAYTGKGTDKTGEVTVKTGDTLWTIAKAAYGDGSRFTELYSKNSDIIEAKAKAAGLGCSESGRYIFAGTVLRL